MAKTPNKQVNKALNKGLQKIYKELFQYIHIRFMDESRTLVDDVYGETRRKAYLPPIKVLGHYVRERSKDADYVKSTDEKETFKVPIQEFKDNNIPYTSQEDIEALRKIVIQFKGFTYQVEEVNPRSVVAGDFLMVTFWAIPAKDYVPDEYDRLREEVVEDV